MSEWCHEFNLKIKYIFCWIGKKCILKKSLLLNRINQKKNPTKWKHTGHQAIIGHQQ